MHYLDNDIIKTLCYADIFDFPLTEREIHQRLISKRKISFQTIKRRVSLLLQNGDIQQTNSHYHLKGRANIVKKRHARSRFSQQKTTTVIAIATKLARIPFLKAVFLTGATAVGNASLQDDLDILIITTPNSLWTCRFLTILYLELLGVRRRPYTQHAVDKICLNLMLSADNLSVPHHMRNLYAAHEVMQVKPLYDPYNYFGVFQKANTWIRDFLPNFSPPLSSSTSSQGKNTQTPGPIETVIRHFQHFYMWPKQTREVITPGSAYFHPRDTGKIVLAKLAQLLKQYRV